MRGGRLSYAEELELLATSGWSRRLHRFVLEHAESYDLVVCTPYLFGVPFWAAQARGCLFNSHGEQRLAERIYGPQRGGVVGMGFDPPGEPARDGFAARHGLGRYVLYAGRIEEAKRVDVLAAHIARYRRERRSDVTLALIGRGPWRPRAQDVDAIRPIGFVDEEEKRSAYAGAVALVNPSELESLSIVLLEAWLEGRPAIVADTSDVLREHVARSGGGLTFGDYESFAAALDKMLNDPDAARAMGAAGRRYVEEEYSWSAVGTRFRQTIEVLATIG
jgi:glycosyltransferase involved in cell wall biosynthesis